MLYTEIDEYGRIRLGLTSDNANYAVGPKRTITLSYDVEKGYSALIFHTEDNIRYRLLQFNGQASDPRFIEVYRMPNAQIKFRLVSSNNVVNAVIHSGNSDSSVAGGTIISRFKYKAPGMYAFMFFVGYDSSQNSDFYQGVYGSGDGNFSISNMTNLPTSVCNHGLMINELDYNTKIELADLTKTTSDIISESAAKYVAR